MTVLGFLQNPRSSGLARSAFLWAAVFCLSGHWANAQVTTDPGLNDLVILDPGKHERGLPAVIVQYMDEHAEIDIPPTVHVHRYYYSGDKIFQGPIIQGGPTVLYASHPKTGEKMYVDVVLPPGAPRISYTKNTISYIYQDKRVDVKFQKFPFDPCVASVKHRANTGLALKVYDAREHVKESLQNSEAINSVKDLAHGGHDLVKGAATGVGELSKKGTDTIKQLAQMIPGVTYLTSKADQKPQRDYESTIRNASLKKENAEIPFIRTNR